MRVLVTGASGFAGSLLVPRLLTDGHRVRALVRRPVSELPAESGLKSMMSAQRSTRAGAQGGDAREAEVLRGDVLTGQGLTRALKDVEIAYYLIHSMERARAGEDAVPFPRRERIAAENFAAAAAKASVQRIVYLGGPAVRGRAPSRHLASREAVEGILRAAVPDTVTLRASIVIGARSRSFRVMVRLIERMPVLALPSWRSHRIQPIDERDVTEMLAACATAAVAGRSLDVGGPDVLSYGEMMARIAELMLVNRPALRIGVSATAVAAPLAAAIAGEDPELVTALMESLQGDLLPSDDHAAGLLNVQLHTFDSAVEHALSEWEKFEPLAAR